MKEKLKTQLIRRNVPRFNFVLIAQYHYITSLLYLQQGPGQDMWTLRHVNNLVPLKPTVFTHFRSRTGQANVFERTEKFFLM
jgi:hypothetical protein